MKFLYSFYKSNIQEYFLLLKAHKKLIETFSKTAILMPHHKTNVRAKKVFILTVAADN